MDYKHILKGYYDTNGKVKALDVLTQSVYYIEERPDLKQRVEKAINDENYLGIYQRGTRNGFKYIEQTELPKNISVVKPQKEKEVNTPLQKPDNFIISDLKWRYIHRCINKGKNIMVVGPAGTGKTQVVYKTAEMLNRPMAYFNLGSTQDVRSSLIGNTFFKEGTYFEPSAFVKAIQTPNTVVLLDEISRANPEAWNILMPVLDVNIRKLRLDEAEDSQEIDVADGVVFVSTANVGFEYTSARSLDRALVDRFSLVEMDILDKKGEIKLLSMKYPDIEPEFCELICSLSEKLKSEASKEDGRITNNISTRLLLEVAEMSLDGFTLSEICDLIIYPQFSSEGGVDSERTYVKQVIQKYTGGEEGELLNDDREGGFWKEFNNVPF